MFVPSIPECQEAHQTLPELVGPLGTEGAQSPALPPRDCCPLLPYQLVPPSLIFFAVPTPTPRCLTFSRAIILDIFMFLFLWHSCHPLSLLAGEDVFKLQFCVTVLLIHG